MFVRIAHAYVAGNLDAIRQRVLLARSPWTALSSRAQDEVASVQVDNHPLSV